MPRYRVEFSKEGPARFLSHLDLVRTTERALRRADLPLAFSRGFHPHPLVQFAFPLPVGAAGEREYFDVELEKNIDLKELSRALSKVFPEGMRVKSVREVPAGAPSLQGEIEKAVYRAEAVCREPLPAEELREKIRRFLDLGVLAVQKEKKGRKVTKNIRPGIFRLEGSVREGRLVLEMELENSSRNFIRPEEVVEAFLEETKIQVAEDTLEFTRTALLFGGKVEP